MRALNVGHLHTLPPGSRFAQGGVDEYLPEWKAQSLISTVRQMRNDPMVAEVLNSYLFGLTSATWSIEPASDKAKDIEIAEFVSANLLCDGPREWWCRTSWRQRLAEILESLSYGWSLFGKVRTRVNGKIIFSKLVWIHPSTVYSFELDENTEQLVEVKRTAVMDPPLPVSELALYSFGMRGADLAGRPMIRPMFKPWSMKSFAELTEQIALQKFGAPLPQVIIGDTTDSGQRTSAEAIARSMRGEDQAHGYAVTSKDVELKFISPESEPMDASPAISRHGNQILHAGGKRFMGQGDTAVGSRSTAETQAVEAYMLAQGIAEGICEVEWRGLAGVVGLIPELVDMNFPGVKEYPWLKVSNVDPNEPTRALPTFGDMLKAGAIKYHPSYELQIVERLKIEPRPGLEEDAELLPDELAPDPLAPKVGPDGKPLPPDPNASPEDGGEAGDPKDKPKAGDEPVDKVKASLAGEIAALKKLPEGSKVVKTEGGRGSKPGGWFREPTAFEGQFIALGAIERELTVFEQRVYALASRVMKDLQKSIVERVRDGRINDRNFVSLREKDDGPNAVRKGLATELENGLARLYRQTGRFGQEQVRDELRKQAAAGAAA